MAKPWEKYGEQSAAAGKPWERYGGASTPPAPTLAERYAAAGINPNEGMEELQTDYGPGESLGSRAAYNLGSLIGAGPQVELAMAGAGASALRTGRGVKQAVTDSWLNQANLATQALRSAGLNDAANFIEQHAAIPLARSSVNQQRQEAEARRIESKGGTAFKAGDIGGTVAQLVGPGILLRGTTAGAAFLPRTLAGNALQGGVLGSLQPVVSESERGANAAYGAGFGAAGHTIGSTIARGASRIREAVAPQVAQLAQRAEALGIPLHISQLSQSVPVKTAASFAKNVPFSGAGKAAQNQQTAFNRAVANTFGANAGELSDDVMKQARQNLSNQFEDIYTRNNVPVSPDSLRRLASIESEVSQRLTRDEAQVVRNQLDNILAEMDQSGTLTGQKYQALRSQIMKAESPDKVGGAVKEVRKALDDIAAQAVGPQDAATLKRIRGQWANLRTIENVLKQVSGAAGNVRPAAIWPAIRNGSTQDMRELGRIGQVVLKDSIPDSGTAGRSFIGGLMAGNPLTWPLLPAAAGAGRVLNSPLAGRVMLRAPGANALTGLSRLPAPAAQVIAVEKPKR